MDNVVSKNRIQELAKCIPILKLTELGRALNVDDQVMENIKEDYQGAYERKYQMLVQWKQKFGAEATNEVLNNALQEVDLGNLKLIQPDHERRVPGSDVREVTCPEVKPKEPSLAAQSSDQPSQLQVSSKRTRLGDLKIPLFFHLTNTPRGICIMLMYGEYTGRPELTIEALSVDISRFKEVFKETLKFEVHILKNSNWQETSSEVKKWSSYDYNGHDSFVCIVSSHGKNGCFLTSDGKEFRINDDLIKPFKNNESLKEKPKIFLINACRGKKEHQRFGSDAERKLELQPPIEADYLIFYSTVEDYIAIGDTQKGSVFMQSICECLKEKHHSMSLTNIFILANGMMDRLAADLKDCQVGTISTTLRKPIYFFQPE